MTGGGEKREHRDKGRDSGGAQDSRLEKIDRGNFNENTVSYERPAPRPEEKNQE